MKGTRRDFIKTATCAAGAITLASQMKAFGTMSTLANVMSSDVSGYKALVLVFLAGGNDGNNMVVPRHNISSFGVTTHAEYFNIRDDSGLALDIPSLLPITVPRMGGLTYGLHPSLAAGANGGLHDLWGHGKLAIVTNVGSLVVPLTRDEYLNQPEIPRPYQLFSHSDQIEQQQSCQSDKQNYSGWGGRVNDIMRPAQVPNPLLPTVTSVAGAQLFTVGNSTRPLVVADAGTPLSSLFTFDDVTGQRQTAINQMLTQDLDQKYIKVANEITQTAISANASLQGLQGLGTVFPPTGIGKQLKQAAIMIKLARSPSAGMNIKRQIFFVQLGGFDTHAYQGGSQASLLSQFSAAVRAFYDEMVDQSAQNDVTTFTMSDFGRTLYPTGTGASAGTDHAWGNHQLVIGGAVAGGNFYGYNGDSGLPYPHLAANGLDDADTGSTARGRWVPRTPNERYAAVLAKWFGLDQSPGVLQTVFPNIGNFPPPENPPHMMFMAG